jgi:beta-lactam-binding protein with PASTA domain
VSFAKQALLALKRILIVIGIAIAFGLGLLGAIYLSLRSSETKVPDILGQDRLTAENTISSAGLNFRVRATRATSEAKPDTVLIQLPHAGEIVKVGQTVAVDLSRASKEGEISSPTSNTNSANTNNENRSENSNSSNSASNSNENKPKKKTANKNANDNQNTNSNRSANLNRGRNGNRAADNTNQPGNVRFNVNANNSDSKGNTNRSGNPSSNRRPPVAVPTP